MNSKIDILGVEKNDWMENISQNMGSEYTSNIK